MNEMRNLIEMVEPLFEGVWSVPNTAESVQNLIKFMAKPQPIILTDTLDITDKLYGVWGNDTLYDEFGMVEPGTDARIVLQGWLVRDLRHFGGIDEFIEEYKPKKGEEYLRIAIEIVINWPITGEENE